jgi:hypothetical protein
MAEAIAPGPPPKRFQRKSLGKGWRGERSLAVLPQQAKPYKDWLPRRLARDPSVLPPFRKIYFGICSSIALIASQPVCRATEEEAMWACRQAMPMAALR